MSDESGRTLVLTVPDWPAVAAAVEHDIAPGRPVAVLHAGRVIAANAPARAAGITAGNNKRAVGYRCPEAHVAVWDEEADNRHFSAGVGALEGLVARFTLLSPGTLAIPLDSLRHGYADEASAVETLVSALVADTGWEFFPGIADTVFAAVLAAGQAVMAVDKKDGTASVFHAFSSPAVCSFSCTGCAFRRSAHSLAYSIPHYARICIQ